MSLVHPPLPTAVAVLYVRTKMLVAIWLCLVAVHALKQEHTAQESRQMLRRIDIDNDAKLNATHTSPKSDIAALVHENSAIKLRHEARKAVNTNVLGATLGSCSEDGEAVTGFMRDGMCTDGGDEDAGSHHICINLHSAQAGGKTFCEVTGQSNWCVEKDTCQGGSGGSSTCPRVHWCVCQWAFASLIADNPDICSQLTMKLAGTHKAALCAYCANQSEYTAALNCLKEKDPSLTCTNFEGPICGSAR
ncbi:unnamed protein product [Amoebophrya sp. A25]|nr:unnamed protein product [Amoebophrya sp. A25]|eukprot:GSA25T00001893001.1